MQPQELLTVITKQTNKPSPAHCLFKPELASGQDGRVGKCCACLLPKQQQPALMYLVTFAKWPQAQVLTSLNLHCNSNPVAPSLAQVVAGFSSHRSAHQRVSSLAASLSLKCSLSKLGKSGNQTQITLQFLSRGPSLAQAATDPGLYLSLSQEAPEPTLAIGWLQTIPEYHNTTHPKGRLS